MKKFRGDDPVAVSILNKLCDIIDRYHEQDIDLEGILYLGRKEMRAIYTIDSMDFSIDRNIETGEIRLWGFPIIPVNKDTYAALSPSIVWRR